MQPSDVATLPPGWNNSHYCEKDKQIRLDGVSEKVHFVSRITALLQYLAFLHWSLSCMTGDLTCYLWPILCLHSRCSFGHHSTKSLYQVEMETNICDSKNFQPQDSRTL